MTEDRPPKITNARRAGAADMSGRSIDADQDLIVDRIMEKCPLLATRLSRIEIFFDLLPLLKPEVYATPTQHETENRYPPGAPLSSDEVRKIIEG
jgi:hypothetical protein